jgi:hypothetical protein
MTGILQTAAAAHHRLKVGHQEGDVIEGASFRCAEEFVAIGIADARYFRM